MSDQKPSIGRIVHFRRGGEIATENPFDYHVAAIITMTPEEWTPGYKGADGEWVENTVSPQPKAGCVHLHVFEPPVNGLQWTPEQLEVRDVPYGEPKADVPIAASGIWYWPPKAVEARTRLIG